MSSTGARCPACDDQAEVCDRCGGRALAPLIGPASVRGTRWAEAVVRELVARWPTFWPRSPRAVIIATRKIADLSRDDALRLRLARVCLEAASRRYSELIDYLLRRRVELPPSPPDEGETPE
jgi:hypothetical protein